MTVSPEPFLASRTTHIPWLMAPFIFKASNKQERILKKNGDILEARPGDRNSRIMHTNRGGCLAHGKTLVVTLRNGYRFFDLVIWKKII